MNWDLLIAEYNSGLEVLSAILALVIFVSSLDDLFIDLWYWTRRIFRRARVERGSQYKQLTADMLRERTEQPIAIMVPITRMRRVRSSKCGRVQTSPQAQRVMKSCHSALKAVLLASARSTQAAPRTLRRASAPLAGARRRRAGPTPTTTPIGAPSRGSRRSSPRPCASPTTPDGQAAGAAG